MTTETEYALLDADGLVVNAIVVDVDDPASLAVLDVVVDAKEGPHAAVASHLRIDKRKTGYDRPGIGRKLRPDGKWRSDADHAAASAGTRREHRDGDELGKPTGRLLDANGEPRKNTELPAVSGKPAETAPGH